MKKIMVLSTFKLINLNPGLIESDYQSLCNAKAHIRKITNDSWPEDSLTKADDLEELQVHENEFKEGTSFAYAVFKSDAQIGSVYLYQSGNRHYDYVCTLWTDCDENDELLYHEAKTEFAKLDKKIAYIHFELTKADFFTRLLKTHPTNCVFF